MKTAKEIAQWVIDNRYPKNEKEKVSDLEMYHELVNMIDELTSVAKEIERDEKECKNCKYSDFEFYREPCDSCHNLAKWISQF